MNRRIAVVGAGLAGVTTAYELAALGCQVQVFERGGSIAEQASFASSALLTPFIPNLAEAPTPAPLTHRFRRWRASRKRSDGAAQLTALTQLGLARTDELRRTLNLDDESTSGLLIALADAKRLAAAESRLESWGALGLQVQLIDANEARLREPGLNAETSLAGALAVPQGGTGNCRLFAQQLRQQAQRLGVEFRFHTTVRAISNESAGISLRHEYTPPAGTSTRPTERDAGDTQPQSFAPHDEHFDAVVLCNGLDALRLTAQPLPLGASHEAAVTAPLRLLEAHPNLGPKAAWADPSRGIVVARIGHRVRVTGDLKVTAANGKSTADFEALHRGLQHWFPGSVLHSQVQHGQSRRALAPDGLPVLGASGRHGVWLSLSPGGGWGMACAAAQVLAQQITGQTTALDLSGLSPQRLT